MDYDPFDRFKDFTRFHEGCFAKDCVVQVQTFINDSKHPKYYCLECGDRGLTQEQKSRGPFNMDWQRIHIYRKKLTNIKGVTEQKIKEAFQKASSSKDDEIKTELTKELKNKNEIIKELQEDIKGFQNRVTALREQLEKGRM